MKKLLLLVAITVVALFILTACYREEGYDGTSTLDSNETIRQDDRGPQVTPEPENYVYMEWYEDFEPDQAEYLSIFGLVPNVFMEYVRNDIDWDIFRYDERYMAFRLFINEFWEGVWAGINDPRDAEMDIVAFIRIFDISRETFDMLVERWENSDTFQFYPFQEFNADIIFSFDDALIRAYYRNPWRIMEENMGRSDMTWADFGSMDEVFAHYEIVATEHVATQQELTVQAQEIIAARR